MLARPFALASVLIALLCAAYLALAWALRRSSTFSVRTRGASWVVTQTPGRAFLRIQLVVSDGIASAIPTWTILGRLARLLVDRKLSPKVKIIRAPDIKVAR